MRNQTPNSTSGDGAMIGKVLLKKNASESLKEYIDRNSVSRWLLLFLNHFLFKFAQLASKHTIIRIIDSTN